MTPPCYAALWCKSNYSFLEGASHPQELVKTASEWGLPALALTDRNGVYGVVRAHEEAKIHGQKLIVGAEVSVDPSSTIVLLATSRRGYSQLCSLLTLGHAGQSKGNFHLSWSTVAEHAADLIALWRPETVGKVWDADLGLLSDAFGDRLYAMVSRHRWTDGLRERETREALRRFSLLPVAVPEVLYHRPERQELQDVLTCIRHGVRRVDAGTLLKPNAEYALANPKEFMDLYRDEPQWVSRTLEIAGRCQFSLSEIEYRYPEEGVPEGYTTLDWLRHLTEKGARKRYPVQVPESVRAQLEKELDVIGKLRYAGYFLTMWEIVEFCRSRGILCQGRGSAANSAVCFCLGITAIDPTQVNLLFERFLSMERAEPPDIDLDISHHRREEVIQHMYELYGRHRAAMVANVVRYRSRSALREVGKVLDIPEVDLDRLAKMVSHYDQDFEGVEAGADLLRLAGEIQEFPRHLSIHPGGFLLGSEALNQLVPVENATMPGRTVIQWDKTDVEAMNLFKVDLLGLGALTHLDYAFDLLKKHRETELSMATLPPDDPATYELICKADTVGVFQIESRAQMAMLPRLRPRNYYDLVVEVSLVRPGPITGGMVHPYLRRRQGLEEVTYPHPCLKPVLEKTLGIPLFQEQVMKLAVEAADYTPGEADQLRRDMAAWKSTGRIDEHHEKLVSRMKAKGIQEEFAERVFAQIRGFGEYGFPESHAASFALIAYATAYLKAHHPDVFACALLNAWPMGFYAPASVIADARRHLVPLLPADVTRSDWDCTLEPHRPGGKMALRMGLRYIKGLVKAEVDGILALRSGLLGTGIEVWKSRCRASVETWEKLAVSGALDSLEPGRRQALWQVLDGTTPVPFDQGTPHPALEEPTETELLTWDYRSQGFSSQGHRLEPLRSRLRQEGFLSAVEVSSAESPRARHAGLVTCRQRPGNAKGVVFLTLEDETGMVNAVIWNNVWDRYRPTLLVSVFLAIEGELQSEQGVVHLIVDHVWSLDRWIDPTEVPSSRDFH